MVNGLPETAIKPKAIDQWGKNERARSMHNLASTHEDFIHRYRPKDPEEARFFDRDLNYLIHMTYRGAQEPITKQLTQFVMSSPKPMRIVSENN